MSTLAARLSPSRWTWRQWGLAVSVLVAAVVIFLYTPRPNLLELKAQGDQLVAGLLKYQTDHGSFPKTLGEAGLEAPMTKWGLWEYALSPEGLAILKVGDYDRYHFMLYWQSDSGWQTDDQ